MYGTVDFTRMDSVAVIKISEVWLIQWHFWWLLNHSVNACVIVFLAS